MRPEILSTYIQFVHLSIKGGGAESISKYSLLNVILLTMNSSYTEIMKRESIRVTSLISAMQPNLIADFPGNLLNPLPQQVALEIRAREIEVRIIIKSWK